MVLLAGSFAYFSQGIPVFLGLGVSTEMSEVMLMGLP